MNKANEFGALLRSVRKQAGRSMGELARHLGVSVSYMSDVELGNRTPLTATNILRAAEFLKADAQALLRAAAASRGAFSFDASQISPKGQEALASLQRGFAEHPDQVWDDILAILNKQKSE